MSVEIRTGLIKDEQEEGLPQAPNSFVDEEETNEPSLHGETLELERRIQRLKAFLYAFGFIQDTALRCILSWLFFVSFGVALPSTTVYITRYGAFNGFKFQYFILVSYVVLAAVSLHYISSKLRKHRIHRFLFVEHNQGRGERFRKEYIMRIKGFFTVLVCWMLPCLFVKIISGIAWIVYNHKVPWWEDIAILFCLIAPWVYLATIYLCACLLFNLVCNSLVIDFEEYGRLLESNSHVLNFLKEHMRLRHHLSKISHRFRMFLLVILFSVTASQFITLLQTTSYSGTINFVNAVDFVVASTIQVVGISLCLHAAAKITHRAQGVASVASRWHAMATCCSAADVEDQKSLDCAANTFTDQDFMLSSNESESDLESMSSTRFPNTRFAANVSSYQKREALVLYLQTNPGGITLFGFSVDRGLINTIFCLEVTLVTFVLGTSFVVAAN
ncbi:uncharacterized protein LOC116248075 isoform X1 [Nymphaea colorata]|nr:uncharacterized protein LOC116248075 isoform X1 [Nymphaea colorata]